MSKRPRSSGEMIAAYCAVMGGLDRSSIAMPPDLPENDRRFIAWKLAMERLGQAGIGAEKVVVDAVARWAGGACSEILSVKGYIPRLVKWIEGSGRLSLSGQCSTKSGSVMEFLARIQSDGHAPRTVAGYRDVIGSWFSWLEHRELIPRSPVTREVRRCVKVDHAAVMKANGMRQALTLNEAQRVAEWILHDAAPVVGLSVALQMTAGLRSGEVTKLERRHLTESEGVWSLTVRGKGSKTRRVVLEQVAIDAWHRYAAVRADRDGALLMAPHGERYSSRQIQTWAKQAAKVVGREIDISSHDLRKTSATLLIEAGNELEQVQKHLGHSSPQLTLRCYVARGRPMAETGIIVPKPIEPTPEETAHAG